MVSGCLENKTRGANSENSEVLTPQEMALLIHHPEDIELVKKIKSMKKQELIEFDKYGPRDLMHYNSLQMDWIKTSMWLLGTRLGRCPSELECMQDYIAHNHYRFRAFYCLKYPDMVDKTRKEGEQEAA